MQISEAQGFLLLPRKKEKKTLSGYIINSMDRKKRGEAGARPSIPAISILAALPDVTDG
jgi:hypothetical protein